MIHQPPGEDIKYYGNCITKVLHYEHCLHGT
ncbi:hypothetical protein BH10PSE19_BH10PSE19_11260 [soil metagenome]